MTENRLKFRVYDIRRKVYFNDPVPPLNSDGTLAFQSSHPDFQKYYITEFCTGFSDKNGNLIYEGDIVKCDRDFDPDGRVNLTKEVIFTDGTFTLANLDPKNRNFCYINRFHNIEIIGNIHEQPEQKDVK